MTYKCRKYFYKHLTDESIKRNILDDVPVGSNVFCNPPKVEEFVEDFIDYNVMKFLHLHDKSLAFIQKKIIVWDHWSKFGHPLMGPGKDRKRMTNFQSWTCSN